ncbi:MAG: SEC-C domain-containing protein [Myxococcales bacterium]|nr:SEC-C domain-containing protein [Myxococcales bacterium]
MSMENGLMWLGLAHDLYEHQQAHAEATPLQLKEPVQVVSPDVATMAVANATYRLTGLNGFRLAVLTVPYAVKQEGHQLYFPEETLRQLRRPWVSADTLAILETQEAVIGKPQPVRREATPGRNDPCYCGSGQKYKRCCAGAGDDGGASL